MMRSLHCPATIGTVTSLAALLPAGSGPGALELFKALPAKNRDPAAIHLILKSLINDNNLALAIEVYKTIPELVPHHPELPSTDTYNILLRGCVSAKSRDTAILLLREMVTRGNVVMDADTYDSLISVALVAVDEANPDSWFDAFTYLQEMKKDGMTPGRATYVKLALGTGARGQGDMAKEVVREMRAAGWQVDKLLTYIHKWDRAKGGNPALGSEGGRVQRLEGTG